MNTFPRGPLMPLNANAAATATGMCSTAGAFVKIRVRRNDPYVYVPVHRSWLTYPTLPRAVCAGDNGPAHHWAAAPPAYLDASRASTAEVWDGTPCWPHDDSASGYSISNHRRPPAALDTSAVSVLDTSLSSTTSTSSGSRSTNDPTRRPRPDGRRVVVGAPQLTGCGTLRRPPPLLTAKPDPDSIVVPSRIDSPPTEPAPKRLKQPAPVAASQTAYVQFMHRAAWCRVDSSLALDDLQTGSVVLVTTADRRGVDAGTVLELSPAATPQSCSAEFDLVIRLAEPEEARHLRRLVAQNQADAVVISQMVSTTALMRGAPAELTFVSCGWQFDGAKLTVEYSAQGSPNAASMSQLRSRLSQRFGCAVDLVHIHQ